MCITLLSALEIYGNPHDLEIVVGTPADKSSEKFALAITRGPGHRFKPIITSSPAFDTAAKAIDNVRYILQTIITAVEKNDSGLPISYNKDVAPVLNTELVDQIIAQLEERQIASTYQMQTQ